MSLIGDLAFSDQRALEQDAAENPVTQPAEPSFWAGSGTSLFQGIVQGAGQLALQAAQYGNDPSQAILMDVPTDADEIARRSNIGEQRQALTERLRPDAQTSGTAAQVLFGLGDTFTRFGFGLASGGMPVAAGTVATSLGEQRYSELRHQGVDAGTAALAGGIEGTVAGVGAFLPAARMFSAPLADFAAVTSANVGLGIAARGGVGAVLEHNGYTEQAKQYKALDGTAMAIDGLLGSAFWGVGRAMGHAPTPEQIDAALAGNNGLHAQHGTAPGAPVDAASSAAHQNALDLAIQQIARGEPVNVADVVGDARFIRGDRIGPEDAVVRDQAKQEVFAGERADLEPIAAAGVPNVRDLRQEMASLNRSLDDLQGAHDSAADGYRDIAKSFQRQGLSRKQAERAARDNIAANRQDIDQQRAATQERIGKIQETLEGNRAAERARAELGAMDRGETPARLEGAVQRRAEEIGNGFKRTALASSVAPDHGMAFNRLASQEMQRLLREGGHPVEEPPVQPVLQEEPARIVPAAAPVKSVTEQPRAATDRAESATPTDVPASADRAASEGSDPLAGIDPALPGLVDSIISGERDFDIPTGAFNEDGSAVTVSARQLLQEADAEIAQATNDSRGFLAAALCSLRFGE
ncbi:hypothetical protein [Pseudomonas sp. RIT-To-2]|uniref:hypothetical protein n=1 Tax=Pseudomonas sp. RIT-To-2 TaxID=3462541 RepID=UPI00241341A9